MVVKDFFAWQKYQFCNYNLFGFKEKAHQIAFNEWRAVAQLKQVVFITVLTAFLYLLFSSLHQFIVPHKFIQLMTLWHMLIIPLMLLFVAILAYMKKFCFLMTSFLIIAPIVAAIANIYIVSKFEGYTTYQTELYLIIFWVFMVSGLRLVHALNTALFIFIIAVISSIAIYPKSLDELIMHIFWMLASLSFGFVGAYLFEDTQKNVFLKHEELEKSSVTDKLTGLYNRKMFDDVVMKEIEKMKRYSHSFGIIMIDIDYFKNINDTYGHHAGDKVLIEIAQILKKNTRISDVLIRWGGEEFIVICLEVSEQDIKNISEYIRQKVEQTHFYKIDKLTISIGTTINREDDDINSIIKRADEALYKAKELGRNRIEYFN